MDLGETLAEFPSHLSGFLCHYRCLRGTGNIIAIHTLFVDQFIILDTVIKRHPAALPASILHSRFLHFALGLQVVVIESILHHTNLLRLIQTL